MNKPVGSITYTSMLTPSGGIKCDLTVTRLAENRFMVVTGGAMGLHDLAWIEAHLPDDGSVKRDRHIVRAVLHRPVGTEGARPAQPCL